MISRALIQGALAIAATTPLAAQAPDGCWSLVMSDWEWVAYRADPGEPTYTPAESAVRFVPAVFELTTTPLVRESGEPVARWYQIRSTRPASEPTTASWRIDPGSIGLRVLWSTPNLMFEASFPNFDFASDSIVGRGGEASLESGHTHDSVPAWIGTAALVRRSCSAAGVLQLAFAAARTASSGGAAHLLLRPAQQQGRSVRSHEWERQ
jgi:hypothetical protein